MNISMLFYENLISGTYCSSSSINIFEQFQLSSVLDIDCFVFCFFLPGNITMCRAPNQFGHSTYSLLVERIVSAELAARDPILSRQVISFIISLRFQFCNDKKEKIYY